MKRSMIPPRDHRPIKRRRLTFNYSPRINFGVLFEKSREELEKKQTEIEIKKEMAETKIEPASEVEITIPPASLTARVSPTKAETARTSSPPKRSIKAEPTFQTPTDFPSLSPSLSPPPSPSVSPSADPTLAASSNCPSLSPTTQEEENGNSYNPFEFVRPPRKYRESQEQSSNSPDRDLVKKMYAISQPSYKNESYDNSFQYSVFRGNTKTQQRPNGFFSPKILSFTQQRQVASRSAFEVKSQRHLKISQSTITPGKKGKIPKNPPKRLTNTQRLQRREKQIKFGKATEGYLNYVRLVPKHKRGPNDPVTPDLAISSSKRSFDKITRQWRRQLHAWDRVKLTQVQVDFLQEQKHSGNAKQEPDEYVQDQGSPEGGNIQQLEEQPTHNMGNVEEHEYTIVA